MWGPTRRLWGKWGLCWRKAHAVRWGRSGRSVGGALLANPPAQLPRALVPLGSRWIGATKRVLLLLCGCAAAGSCVGERPGSKSINLKRILRGQCLELLGPKRTAKVVGTPWNPHVPEFPGPARFPDWDEAGLWEGTKTVLHMLP